MVIAGEAEAGLDGGDEEVFVRVGEEGGDEFCGGFSGDVLEAAEGAVDDVDVWFFLEERGDDGDGGFAADDEEGVDGGFADEGVRVGDEVAEDGEGEEAGGADGGER